MCNAGPYRRYDSSVESILDRLHHITSSNPSATVAAAGSSIPSDTDDATDVQSADRIR